MKMNLRKPNLRSGFTLIELLIVVAIIGILAVALVPTISDAPARARDAARKASVNSVLSALESYNIDNGSYPEDSFCIDNTQVLASDAEDFVTNYLKGNPPSQSSPSSGAICVDGDNSYVRYETADSGKSYSVFIELEKAGNASITTYDETTENVFNEPASQDPTHKQIFLIKR